MIELESAEFRKMLIASAVLHALIIVAIMTTTSISSFRYAETPSPGPMNVMWAQTVRMPQATAPHKLPGPIVPIQIETASSETPKIVMPEDLKKAAEKSDVTKNETADEARKRAMAEAIASLRKNITDDRPMPRADNFPSKGMKNAEEGVPSGPGGLRGMMGGDPVFSGYKNQVERIIIESWVLLQKGVELKAEVTFSIDFNGNIIDPAVTTSSGNMSFDQSVLRAVKKSSPLPPPPVDLAAKITREQFAIRFDSKMK
jgi:colicin import membrane protein